MSAANLIHLYTDFGAGDPYVGQMRAVLARQAPGVPVIDLLHAAPTCAPQPAAHLLAALAQRFAPGEICIAVVDPGVGTARDALVLKADGVRYVGPDNGLLAVVAARARSACWWRIDWRPAQLSESFHGRDLFAPVAAGLATGTLAPGALAALAAPALAHDGSDLGEVIYIDHYGNAMTGVRASALTESVRLRVAGQVLAHARVFGQAPPGEPFWYANSIGLAEIAVPGASAALRLGLALGVPVLPL